MSGAVLMPREAGRYIAENSQDVKIKDEGVKQVAKLIYECVKTSEPTVHVDRWKTHQLNPKTSDKAAIDWIFLSDIGNFSFWSDDEDNKYEVVYQGKTWTGYWSWCAAINRALDEGIPFTDPKYYADLTEDKLRHLLRSDSDVSIPMLRERLQVLKEAGKVLNEKYDGSFVNVLKTCNKSADKFMKIVTEDFPSLRDVAEFKGKSVAIYKRAQILIADIWACCGGEGYGEFHDIDTITMFADYRIPQALVWLGAIEYSERLNELMKSGHIFKTGDVEEVEIRGCTIWAVELVVMETKKLMLAEKGIGADTVMNAILIDHFLWDYRREHAKETQVIPIHKIRCIYY